LKTPHKKTLPWLDWRRGQTAKLPRSAKTGAPLQGAVQYLTQWAQNGNQFTFTGPPERDINGEGNVEGEVDCCFYVIFHSPARPGGVIWKRLGALLVTWRHDTGGDAQMITWRPDYSDAGDERTLYDEASFSMPADTYGDLSHGIEIVLGSEDFVFSPLDTEGAMVCGRLRCRQLLPAALSIFQIPDSVGDLDREQLQVILDDMEPARVIRGYDPADTDCDRIGSLGGLQHLVAAPKIIASWTDNVEATTRRVLFQWGHPRGLWLSGSELNIFGDWTFRVRLRELAAAPYDQICYPGVIVQGGSAGATITYTSSIAGDAWIFTFAQTIAAPTLITWDHNDAHGITNQDGLYCRAGAEEEITISCTVAGEDKQILVHTVALCEGPSAVLRAD